MEFEMRNSNHLSAWLHRLLPSTVPAVLISIGYVDPGKWAATIEGGVHFGFDLVALMFTFNLAAILCQYLAARVGAITGKDLAAICNEEYDKYICILLGIQVEFSMIVLDITMILGIAHGLNLLLGMDLFTCVFLTTIDVVFFPLFASLMQNSKTKFLCLGMACFVLLAYAFGVLLSQPEISISANGMPTKLSGESAFALMSLLGASIVPQNFYLHSALVKIGGQQEKSLEDQCFSHFVSTLLVFSCINLVTYGLMNSAANVFYSTFQEVLEQVLRSPLALFLYLMVLLCSSQVSALTWNIGGEVILHNFFGLDIPSWLHRATIRIFAIIAATYFVWSSGAEGIYQLLVFMQVMVALLLPLSVIPLFRIASSRALMGIHKISQVVEFLALVMPVGMLVFVVIFVVEMIFGNSEWAGNLRLNIGGSSSVPFTVLLVTASASLGMMLWLSVTPLKSASSQLDSQLMSWDRQNAIRESSRKKEVSHVDNVKYFSKENIQTEASPQLGESLESHSISSADNFGADSLEVESDVECHLTTIEENQPSVPLPCPPISHSHDEELSLKSSLSSVPVDAGSENPDAAAQDKAMKIEVIEPMEKILNADVQERKDDCETETWELEESIKMAPSVVNSSFLTSDGPGSFRSLSGKCDDGGNGAGSLSRLAGLGRGARRQLAALLDEFWGQLYDFHGQATQEAKAKRLDMLLGQEIKIGSSTMKIDASGLESSGYFPGSDSLISSNLIDSPEQRRMSCGLDSPYGVQRGSSLWSNQMRMDTYVQNSNRSVFDGGEKRYSSLRLPPSDARDKQPTTVHGCQIASCMSRIAADRSSHCYDGLELPVSKSLSLGPMNYKDSNAFALGQRLQNSLSPLQNSSYQNIAGSGNNMIPTERLFCENISSGPLHTFAQPGNTKKYHSLPDISGISVAQRDLTSNKNSQWDSSIGFGSSLGRTSYETSPYMHSGLRSGAPLTFDELSPSGKYREALSMQLTSSSDTASLWSRQPFEPFSAADKIRPVGSGIESSSISKGSGCGSVEDPEAMLLQSFRQCILKLLKLEGSDWLFKQNDGVDEDLIDRVAAREKFLSDAENKEMNPFGDAQYHSDRRSVSAMRNEGCYSANLLVSSIPHCGDDCIWRADLIISFGVWCIHRILDLSLMESRPELWGKYTFVLNRLQGIIDLAFSKPRTPKSPCLCLEIAGVNFQQASVLSGSNGSLPPPSKPGRGKCTSAAALLDIIKDVEIAISSRKGRTGTAAGDVAYPKGKENLASVLKRYKRRLSNKPTGTLESVGSRKILPSALYGS